MQLRTIQEAMRVSLGVNLIRHCTVNNIARNTVMLTIKASYLPVRDCRQSEPILYEQGSEDANV
jgi:hypothetical protein